MLLVEESKHLFHSRATRCFLRRQQHVVPNCCFYQFNLFFNHFCQTTKNSIIFTKNSPTNPWHTHHQHQLVGDRLGALVAAAHLDAHAVRAQHLAVPGAVQRHVRAREDGLDLAGFDGARAYGALQNFKVQ